MKSDILSERIEDILRQSENHSRPQFIGFLSGEETSAALIKTKNDPRFMFFGGYTDAERVCLGAFPEYLDPSPEHFPIEAITFTFREQDLLSHRDFLGAVLALGIERQTIGDILVTKGRAVMFVSRDVCDFILNELRLVGRTGVMLTRGIMGELPDIAELQEISFTVASLRLDCIVSAVCNISRGAATELIEGGRVSLNSVITEKVTKSLCEGDKITVRRSGKFILKNIGGTTKKGRLKIIIDKYV